MMCNYLRVFELLVLSETFLSVLLLQGTNYIIDLPPWIIIEITKLALLKIKLRNQSVIRLYSYTEIKLLTIIISQDVEVGHSHKACSI